MSVLGDTATHGTQGTLTDEPAATPPAPSPPGGRGNPGRKNISFQDAIAQERQDGELPGDFDTPSGRLRQALLHGHALTPNDAAELTGGSTGLLHAVVKNMKEWGFRFEKLKGPKGNAYRLLNKAHIPRDRVRPNKPTQGPPPRRTTSKALERAEQEREQQRARPTSGAIHQPNPHMNGNTPEDREPTPSLDDNLEVYLVYRDRQTGDVKVGIHNREGLAWLCTVDGHVADGASI